MGLESLSEWLRDFSVPVSLVAVLLGLANCFFGYRFFRFMLGVIGFILGAAAGAVLSGSLGDGGQVPTLLGVLIGGVIGAGLLVGLYFLGVFLFGALTGAMLIGAVGAGMGTEMPPVAVVLGAVIVGLVAVALQKIVIILATALSGAWTTVLAGSALLAGEELDFGHFWGSPPWEEALVPLVAWLALAAVGAIVQFRKGGG